MSLMIRTSVGLVRRAKRLIPGGLRRRIDDYRRVTAERPDLAPPVPGPSPGMVEAGQLLKFNPSLADLEANSKVIEAQASHLGDRVKTMVWFVPHIPVPHYGGIFTIYRCINHLMSKGVRVIVAIRDCPKDKRDDYAAVVRSLFPSLAKAEIFHYWEIDEVKALPRTDAAFATDWPSAYSCLTYNNTKAKYYFVQDYESLCYASGPMYGLAETTYGFGFTPVCNTRGLYQFYMRQNRPARSMYFNPAVDKHLFHPRGRSFHYSTPTKIFYYCRPHSGRNGFTMGVTALAKIKERFGDKVEIVMAGSTTSEPYLEQYKHLFTLNGLMGYEETGDLYRKCHVGLVTMYTPHTSYLPFELMGCGVAVVTNGSPAKEWLIEDGYNGYFCMPTVDHMVAKLDDAIRDIEKREQIAKNGVKTIMSLSWNSEMEKVFGFIHGKEVEDQFTHKLRVAA